MGKKEQELREDHLEAIKNHLVHLQNAMVADRHDKALDSILSVLGLIVAYLEAKSVT